MQLKRNWPQKLEVEGGSELLTYLPADDHGSEMMLRLRIQFIGGKLFNVHQFYYAYSKNVMEIKDPFHLYLASMEDMAIWDVKFPREGTNIILVNKEYK